MMGRMAPLLKVRRATVADEFALFALVRLFPTPTPPLRETFAGALRLKLRDSDGFVVVAEEARRQGIGRALMAEFEAWAENGRCRLIGLATRAAATFYEELGFEDSAGFFKRYLRPEDRTKSEL